MANVKLSVAEIELMSNAGIILTKNKILQQVQELFGSLASYYQSSLENKLPLQVNVISPKIAKGENYQGLPWLMLDYPRYFTNQDIFAIRTFFWWGNFCSITLLLKGSFKETSTFLQWQEKEGKLQETDWFFCTNHDSLWKHDFILADYKPLKDFSIVELKAMPFVKLSKKIPLNKWDEVENFMQSNFKELTIFLND